MTNDPSDLPPDLLSRIPLFAELQRVLSWSGGPVNWDLARQIAVAAAASAESAHDISADEENAVREDARVAELWLAEATGLAVGSSLVPARASTPARWAEHACTAFRDLIDPLAAKVARAMSEQASTLGDTGEHEIDPSMIHQALAQMAPLFLGVQAGSVFGALAKDVLGQHDLAIPSDDDGAVTVIVPTVDAFASSYGIDQKQARLWVTLHETAHRAEFESFSVRPHFFALYHDYVASLHIDLSSAMGRMQELDLSDPAALESAVGSSGFFDTGESPATAAALAKLERLMSIVEAFADRAVEAAAGERLPDASRIAEAIARRRAGDNGLQLLKQLIGIGPSAESLRAADTFVRAVLDGGGWTTLARVWEDPQLLPTDEDLTNPTTWMRRLP